MKGIQRAHWNRKGLERALEDDRSQLHEGDHAQELSSIFAVRMAQPTSM
jgi:hypothetical protein